MDLETLKEQVADHLGIEVLPIKYKIMTDDSRLYAKEGYVAINLKYKDNFIETAKSITHEYRHAFQIYYARLMNDARALRWREELGMAKNGDSVLYLGQELELDAFAFTKWYMKKYLEKEIIHPNDKYEKVIEMYIEKYREIL